MPLDPSALANGLESVAADPPPTTGACAQAWADAVEAWAIGIVPPSSTVSAAAATLATALVAAFELPAAAPAMEAALATFAATVGGGMAGYTPTPPPGPVGLVAQFASAHPVTHAAAATAVGGLIDAWMRTGLATLIAPPNTVVPWS